MHFGGDYYPEQWTPDVWREDIARMREANVTIVTVGVFAWARIQPSEGEFDWGWLDEVLQLLHDAGIAVDLATATASPPPWATAAYPGMLPRDIQGTVYSPGSRQHYAPTSPDYRRLPICTHLNRNRAMSCTSAATARAMVRTPPPRRGACDRRTPGGPLRQWLRRPRRSSSCSDSCRLCGR